MEWSEKNMLDKHQSEYFDSNPSFALAGDLGQEVSSVKWDLPAHPIAKFGPFRKKV